MPQNAASIRLADNVGLWWAPMITADWRVRDVDAVDHHLTASEWTMVAFNASAVVIVPPAGARLRGRIAGESAPLLDTPDFFPIRSVRIVRGIAPFEALWLRADADATAVTVYRGNTMSGVVFFGKSPFRLGSPGLTSITVPYVPQTLDGGAPDTDYAGLAVIDCGGVAHAPDIRTIDGRTSGETP